MGVLEEKGVQSVKKWTKRVPKGGKRSKKT